MSAQRSTVRTSRWTATETEASARSSASVPVSLSHSAFVPAALVQEEQLPNAPAESVLSTTTTTVEPDSPTTTSEFGTETEIEISLDEHGNVVPG
jgi:hypothetical protein